MDLFFVRRLWATIYRGLINLFVWIPLGYIQGICFLIMHPLDFIKFVHEYKRFQFQIEKNDQKILDRASIGYYGMNRRQRRANGLDA